MTATPTRYRQCLERYPSLENLIQPVAVRPATVAETVDVLRGVRNQYETHHRLVVTDEAVTAIAESADRQLPGALPGKAVLLLDRSAARARIHLWGLAPDVVAVRELDDQIKHLNEEKEQVVADQDFPRAGELRDQGESLKNEVDRIRQEHRDRSQSQEMIVDARIVSEVVRELSAAMTMSGPATE